MPESFLLFLGKNDDDRDSLIEPGSPKIVIERTVFSQKTFDDQFEPGRRPTSTIQERTKRQISKYSRSPSCCKDFLFTIFPILGVLKSYNIRTDLSGDIISGLTVGIMHIPQGKHHTNRGTAFPTRLHVRPAKAMIEKTPISYSHLSPNVALWLTLSGSNYQCLEQVYIVPKMFELLRFDCIIIIVVV